MSKMYNRLSRASIALIACIAFSEAHATTLFGYLTGTITSGSLDLFNTVGSETTESSTAPLLGSKFSTSFSLDASEPFTSSGFQDFSDSYIHAFNVGGKNLYRTVSGSVVPQEIRIGSVQQPATTTISLNEAYQGARHNAVTVGTTVYADSWRVNSVFGVDEAFPAGTTRPDQLFGYTTIGQPRELTQMRLRQPISHSINSYGLQNFTVLNYQARKQIGDLSEYVNILGARLSVSNLTLVPGWALHEMAAASDAAYLGGEILLGTSQSITSNVQLGLNVVTYRRGNELLVAIRGTELGSEGALLKNIASDFSWIAGVPNARLTAMVEAAANVVRISTNNNADLNVTFTGHSLGGAVAQVLGRASQASTVTFNAPGTGQWDVNDFAGTSGLSVGRTGLLQNYRLQGDFVSQVGTQVGSVTTIENPFRPMTELVDTLGLCPNGWCLLRNHSMNTLRQQIGDSQDDVPPLSSYGLDARNSFSAIRYATFLSPKAQAYLVISGFVIANTPYLIDPEAAAVFEFVVNAGSPLLSSVLFPDFGPDTSFVYEARSGVHWGAGTDAVRGEWVSFLEPISGLRYSIVDANGNIQNAPADFFVGMKFASSGNLDATLLAAPVPEPSGLAMTVGGLVILVAARRRYRPMSAGFDAKPSQSQLVLDPSNWRHP